MYFVLFKKRLEGKRLKTTWVLEQCSNLYIETKNSKVIYNLGTVNKIFKIGQVKKSPLQSSVHSIIA